VQREIDNMNLAFSNSGISQVSVTWSDIVPTWTEYAMGNNSGPESDTKIGISRDLSNADIVITLVAPAGPGTVVCGYTDMILPVSTPLRAYATVASDCFMNGQLALNHEAGHIMGLRHDVGAQNAGETPGYPNSHGYRFVVKEPGWPDRCENTLMAAFDGNTPSCAGAGTSNYRINYYGNPGVSITYGGAFAPTGNTASQYRADEAHTLLATMPIVANFRFTKTGFIGRVLSAIFTPLLND
jgi:hypothetical protein